MIPGSMVKRRLRRKCRVPVRIAMKRRERVVALLALLGLVIVVRLGTYLYRWYAYAEERATLQGLSTEVSEAGAGVVRTQLTADSLAREIERLDEELRQERGRFELYERMARSNELPTGVYRVYRGWLAEYNRRVEERNARFERWREVVEENHRQVDRYNALADSIRGLAESIGDPYFEIPSPAEAAVEEGVPPPGV